MLRGSEEWAKPTQCSRWCIRRSAALAHATGSRAGRSLIEAMCIVIRSQAFQLRDAPFISPVDTAARATSPRLLERRTPDTGRGYAPLLRASGRDLHRRGYLLSRCLRRCNQEDGREQQQGIVATARLFSWGDMAKLEHGMPKQGAGRVLGLVQLVVWLEFWAGSRGGQACLLAGGIARVRLQQKSHK